MTDATLVPERPDTVTIFERSQGGRRAFVAPASDVPELAVSDLLPASAIRAEPPAPARRMSRDREHARRTRAPRGPR